MWIIGYIYIYIYNIIIYIYIYTLSSRRFKSPLQFNSIRRFSSIQRFNSIRIVAPPFWKHICVPEACSQSGSMFVIRKHLRNPEAFAQSRNVTCIIGKYTNAKLCKCNIYCIPQNIQIIQIVNNGIKTT